ncbi:MAG: prepilin-type N-terminal cleavage/methylation domain-containing protein [Desulfobacterales bacterium]|jgi:prepilin-type N-terminal cleavage/methylation domain-containing protein
MKGDAIYRQRHAGRAAGFTLVEVLVCLALLSILFGTIYRSFSSVNRSYTKENVKAGVQQKARIGIDLMARDIRLAGLDPLAEANAGFISAGTNTTSIQFTADLNYDGDIIDPFENITYNLNGDRLEQTSDLGTGISVDTLLDNVTALTFTYLDASDTALAEPIPVDQIASVLISLTVQRPSGRDDPISRTYTTRVRCRNL